MISKVCTLINDSLSRAMYNEKNLKMFEDKMNNMSDEIIEQSQNLLKQLDSSKTQPVEIKQR